MNTAHRFNLLFILLILLSLAMPCSFGQESVPEPSLPPMPEAAATPSNEAQPAVASEQSEEVKSEDDKSEEVKSEEVKSEDDKSEETKSEEAPKEEKTIQQFIPATKVQTVADGSGKDATSAADRNVMLAKLIKDTEDFPWLKPSFFKLESKEDLAKQEEAAKAAPVVIPLDKIPQDIAFPVEEETTVVETTDGQTVTVKTQEVPKTEEPPKDPKQLKLLQQMMNPRALVKFFLDTTLKNNYPDAIMAMDFSKMPDISLIEKQDLAFKLRGILLRLDNFDLDLIPEETQENIYYIWPDRAYKVIVLQKSKDGVWKFATASVADITRFYDQIQSKPPVFTQKTWLRFLPSWIFQRLWGLTYIQWFFLGIYFLIGYIVYKVLPIILTYMALLPFRLLKRENNYAALTQRAIRPLAYLAMVYLWYVGFSFVQVQPVVIKVLGLIIHPFGIFMLMIAVMRSTDLFGEWLRNRFQKTDSKIGNVLVDLSTRTIKFLIICLGVVGVAQVYGFSAIGIVSGMGIGGIAVALAAQQTISNFFGSITILLDRPFTVGDWVITSGVEGSIESIGLRSTRIRTFYNSLVIIPNSSLATSTIDNMGKRLFRRYKAMIGVQYDTPVELMQAFCSGIRTLIESYPTTRKDDIRVYVNEFSASSIDILLVCFFIAKTAAEENEARQQLILDTIRLAKQLGVQFAFPSVTQYNIDSCQMPTYPIADQLSDSHIKPEEFGRETALKLIGSN